MKEQMLPENMDISCGMFFTLICQPEGLERRAEGQKLRNGKEMDGQTHDLLVVGVCNTRSL